MIDWFPWARRREVRHYPDPDTVDRLDLKAGQHHRLAEYQDLLPRGGVHSGSTHMDQGQRVQRR